MSNMKVLSPVCPQLTNIMGHLPKSEDMLLVTPLLDELIWGDAITRARTLRSTLEDRIRIKYADTLVLPPSLLSQLTLDVLQISKDEPCGIRGCVLIVNLSAEASESNTEKELLRTKTDNITPTTHELVVTLQPDTASWYTKMTKIFRSLSKRKIVISQKYELRNNKVCNFEE